MMDRTNKLYLARLEDHLRMLKRRQRAMRAAVTRKGITLERIDIEFKLMQQIEFMNRWISEVKK